MDASHKQPPSYIDYMNDVFESSLPNTCADINPNPQQPLSSGSGENSAKEMMSYRDKWLHAAHALDDHVIIRINGVDFGINWKIQSKLEPALESNQVLVREMMEGGAKVYVVNRHVSSFMAILDYHRNGDLHMPSDVCPKVFRRELDFWRVDFRVMSQCCLRKYANFQDNEDTLSEFDNAHSKNTEPVVIDGSHSRWKRIQTFGWAILSNPTSSVWAKIYLGVASFFVILSIFLLAASTNPTFLRKLRPSEWEEFMTSEELDMYYELIYKRPKSAAHDYSRSKPDSYDDDEDDDDDDADALEKQTNTTTIHPPHSAGGNSSGHQIGKRSAPDERNKKMASAKTRRSLRERRSQRNTKPEDNLVEPLNLNTLVDSAEVDRNLEPLPEREHDNEDKTVTRIDLDALLYQIISTIAEQTGKNIQVNRRGKPVQKDIGSEGRMHREIGRDADRITEAGEYRKDNFKLRYNTNSQGQSEDPETEDLHRSKRSTGANNSKSDNFTSNGQNNTMDDCIFMDRKTLESVITETAVSAVSLMTGDRVRLPKAYAVYDWAKYLEMMCVAFFVAEFFIRFIFAPSKVQYLLSFFTIIDFLALVTMFSTLLIDTLNPKEKYRTSVVDAINCFQVIRVFRFFRLMKDVVGFRVLIFSIRSSYRELILLVLYIIIAVTIFSTVIYYAEKDNMQSIPDAFWWAIVTMTTVGYGDMAPKTLWGKLIGVACALSGVLLIAVTVPVFVNNFLLFYEHSKVTIYDKKKIKGESERKHLSSDSASDVTDTTSVGRDSSGYGRGGSAVTREGSACTWNSLKSKLKSDVTISRVTPILINSKDGEAEDNNTTKA